MLRFHTNHLLSDENALNGRVNRTDMLLFLLMRGRSQLSAAFAATSEAAKPFISELFTFSKSAVMHNHCMYHNSSTLLDAFFDNSISQLDYTAL